MAVFINNIIELIKTTMLSYPTFVAIFLGIFLTFIESFFPILPLCAFVAINVILFGNIIGVLISYLGTLIGSFTSFIFFKSVLGKYFYKKIKNNYKLLNLMEKIKNFSFSKLVMLMSFPFTPSCSVNIACGLAGMNNKKFMSACFLAKLPMVYFWGYVGTTFIESLTNPYALINIILILTLSYIASKIFMYRYKI